MNNNFNTHDGLKEMGRVLSEKITTSDAGKIAAFAVFAGGMIYGLKAVLASMKNHTDAQNS